jgi:peptide/nickel transport system permease protein
MVLPMGLRGYIIKRIIYTFFLVIFVLCLNFVIFEILPHNPLQFFAGTAGSRYMTKAQLQQIMHLWGLDQPWPVKFLTYMKNMLTFQFGLNSPSVKSPRDVASLIMLYLPNTLVLMGISTIFEIIIGVVLGVIAAYRRGGLFDNAAVMASLLTYALPTFWIGLIFIFIFSINTHLLPPNGIVDYNMPNWTSFFLLGTHFSIPSTTEIINRISHLILPVTVLTLVSFGGYMLLTRATMMESLTEDYILTAKAKGLKERTIIFKHALKNASLPIITSAAMSFGFLISGALITETVFDYPGIGWLTINSIFGTLNMPALQAIFYVIALCVIFANFASDLLYGVIDPRIKYG